MQFPVQTSYAKPTNSIIYHAHREVLLDKDHTYGRP